ncbi:MAG: BspA family leucine-rich repeat surface protein [Bacteroidales bacterium]|nr:BspA family leucine-rich repeat surface protein [Bacteroidales bacterium]
MSVFALLFPLFAFSQPFTAKLLSANGSSWGQVNHKEKTSKGNDVYIGDLPASTFNTTKFPYIKARLAYLSNDNMGSCNIRSIQNTTFAEGSKITRDPSKYYRKTCLSISYDKEWLDWKDDAEKDAAINSNTTYPEIVYAYSVPNGELYDVFFYSSDDSDPLVEGQCTKLFKVGPDEYEGKYEDLSGLEHWYFENVTDLDEMFSQCGSLKKVGISGDFSLVKTLKNMFYNCASIEEVRITGDFGEKLTTLESTFENCGNLKSITLDGEFKNVTNINSMFKNCSSLEEMSINGRFSTKLTTAKSVFEGCTSLESVSILDTDEVSDAKAQLKGDFSKVTSMPSIFKNCTNLEKAKIKGNFASLTNVNSLFEECTALSAADLDFGADVITEMKSMFRNCKAITSATVGDGSDADVTVKGNFSNVATAQDMFNGCSILKDTEIKGNFSSLTSVSSMFSSCTALENITLDGTFSSLTSLVSLFSGRSNLKTATINGSFNELTTMQEMFKDCDKITTALFNTEGDSDVKISGTFPKLESMNGMFRDCDKLSTASLEIPETVTVLNNLFKNSKLTSANVSNIANVTTMESMFSTCSNLTDVLLSGDFSNVTTIKELFNNATKVANVSLNDGDADFSSLNNVYGMVNNWDISKYDVFASIFSQMNINTENLPGAKNDNHKISNKGWTGKTVMTKNLAEYDVTNGYLATLLPIELSYFSITQNDESLYFEWETATETNNDFFTIEQSIDGVSFHEMAWIAGAGTSSTSNFYEYSISTTFSGLMYFRLKQTDYNGDYSYSDVQTIFVGDNEYVILYPTIATDFITIEGDYESVKFIDMQGKIQHPTRMQGNTYPIAALPQGMHYAIISLKNGEIVTRQFFKK